MADGGSEVYTDFKPTQIKGYSSRYYYGGSTPSVETGESAWSSLSDASNVYVSAGLYTMIVNRWEYNPGKWRVRATFSGTVPQFTYASYRFEVR